MSSVIPEQRPRVNPEQHWMWPPNKTKQEQKQK